MTTHQDTAPRNQSAGKPAPGAYRFTGQQYRCMIETGVLGPEDNVELIQGEIRPPMSSEHGASSEQLDEWFQDRRENDYRVRCHLTLHLVPDFSPDPDLAIVRRRDRAPAASTPSRQTSCSSSKYPRPRCRETWAIRPWATPGPRCLKSGWSMPCSTSCSGSQTLQSRAT